MLAIKYGKEDGYIYLGIVFTTRSGEKDFYSFFSEDESSMRIICPFNIKSLPKITTTYETEADYDTEEMIEEELFIVPNKYKNQILITIFSERGTTDTERPRQIPVVFRDDNSMYEAPTNNDDVYVRYIYNTRGVRGQEFISFFNEDVTHQLFKEYMNGRSHFNAR